MSKILKILLSLLVIVLIFLIFIQESQATSKYYSGVKRTVKKVYYKSRAKLTPTVKLNIPFHHQEHSLSCEVAALRMALLAKGADVAESTLISQLPSEPMWGNPHRGFVGDINGKMLKTGYGVYWGPIATIGANYRPTQSFEDATASFLATEIQNGNPVIIWTHIGRGRWPKWIAPDGTPILGIPGEHTQVVIGFTGSADRPTGFYLLDPLYGEQYQPARNFLVRWTTFGNSGVVVR